MKKSSIVLLIVSLIVIVFSVTYAFFKIQIIGDAKNITVNSKDLKIVFNGGDSITGSELEQFNYSKTFTIENKSDNTYKYNIIIKDLVNTFKTDGFLLYKITSDNNGYSMSDFDDVPKSETEFDTVLAYNVSIDADVKQTYTIEFKYTNSTDIDQSADLGAKLSGKLFIDEGSEKPTLLYDKILSDNSTIKTRTTFTAFTETNTGTLYKATEQIGTNPVKDVYYFAGDAKNNWVKFGKTKESSCTYKGKELFIYNDTGLKNVETQTECETYSLCSSEGIGPMLVENSSMCGNVDGTILTEKATWNGTSTKDIYWRIIRTNADGSIKLLYAGTSPDTEKAYIGMSAFNTTYNDPMYVGYKYGVTGSLNNNRTNTNDSTIKAYIDNWYKNNLITYTKYLSKDAVYCNDRNLASGQTYSTTNNVEFASSERLGGDTITPTYNCTNMSDAFSVNNASAKLDYPIGLMSIDELSYAGGQFNTNLDSPSAWYYTNANGESSCGKVPFWSISPSLGSGSFSGAWYVNNSILTYTGTNFSSGVRPSISLKYCTLYSTGNGTYNEPYEIKETKSGC